MKKLSLVLIGISISFTASSNIYCPKEISCSKGHCTFTKDSDPNFKVVGSSSGDIKDGYYNLYESVSKLGTYNCSYEYMMPNYLIYVNYLLVDLVANVDSHYSRWQMNDKGYLECMTDNPLYCPFYDIDTTTTAQAK